MVVPAARLTKTCSLAILKEAGLPVGTILDVGVRDQTEELRLAFPLHKHLLFEPVREHFDAIRSNYKDMDYQLIETAVSRMDGEGSLAIFSFNDMDVSHSTLVEGETPNTRTVRVVTLDSFLSRHPELTEPFLLKIDVDGNEPDVLAGATKTLPKCSVVICEVTISSYLERAQMITQAGFRLWDIVDLGFYDQGLHAMDLIFIRDDLFASSSKLNTSAFRPFDINLWEALY